MGGVTAEKVQSEKDIYLISAEGNGYTSRETIEQYVLLKAAETTKAAGASHFQVERGSGKSTMKLMRIVTSDAGVITVTAPVQTMYIRVLPPGQKPPDAISADEIIQTIGVQVKRG